MAAGGLDTVIDVGCAEGYYAVGLARLMPDAVVHAHDISEGAREACGALARLNDVADRVRIGGEFKPQDFENYAGSRVLVLVDIEGGEVDLLDPAKSPSLAGMNIIVETHDHFRPGALAELRARFGMSHDIDVVRSHTGAVGKFPDWLEGLSELDHLTAMWEWREHPTPWLVMHPKT